MGVSGNSVAGKSFQMFTVSEELLAKVTEAVQAGEKKARSSGDVQSFEVFCHGFRMNISLGRLMIVPPAVCSDRKNFPVALLHGALVRVFGTGGEEISDLIEKKIGESEFDEYSQADFDTIKTSLFVDPRTEKEACLIVFAPNWMNSREYITFHFTKDSEQLKNNLRHQIFSAYYDPRVSSAFNAMMTNVNTTKVDVTDITPKLNFPFLAENVLKEYPELLKQAGSKKAHVLLNYKTADDVTKETLDPQELDVFDSLNTALENSLMPSVEDAESAGEREGGYKTPAASPDGVPRAASTKIAHVDSNGICPGCKKAGAECACQNCTCKQSSVKTAYVAHVPGHKDSKGGAAPWVVKDHTDDHIISSYKSKGLAESGLKNMESHKGSKAAAAEIIKENPIAPHETPFTNVGPGTEAEAEQEGAAAAMKETVGKDFADKATDAIGIELDEQGRPVHHGDDVKEHRSSKKEALVKAPNPKTNKHDMSHPETLRVGQERLSTAASELFNGGFVNKADWPPKEIADYAGKHIGNNDTYAPHAVADHQKQIEAGLYGETPFDRRAQEKWGSAERKTKMADYVADIIAAGIEDDSEIGSEKSKAASKQHQSMLDKFRPKTAVSLDIDSIWDEITEDMGPAPLVDVETTDNNPAPSTTEGETRSGEGSSEGGEDEAPAAPSVAPRKSDVSDLPEAFRSDEPEEAKSMSEPEAESQEDSMPHADSDTGENTESNSWEEKESSWRLDEKLADFVGEVYADANGEQPSDFNHLKELAQIAIDNESDVALDVAANTGQMFGNVKHMTWFIDAVAEEIAGDEELQRQLEMMQAELPEQMPSLTEEASAEGEYVGDNNPAMMASSKKADTADNEYDIDAAAQPTKKEMGKSDTVECHEDHDSKGQVYAAEKAKERKCPGCDTKYSNDKTSCPKCGYANVKHKQGDTADNPYNMQNDGAGAPENKKVVRKKDTTGPTPDNTKQGAKKKAMLFKQLSPEEEVQFKDWAMKNNPPDLSKWELYHPVCRQVWEERGITPQPAEQLPLPTASAKKADDVSGDFREAKSEIVSPDTVDADIEQPTTSVGDAGARKHSSDAKTAAIWLNEGEAEMAAQRFANHPVLGPATKFLLEFIEQVNSHSDGWHSWPLPGRAAGALQQLIQDGLNNERSLYTNKPQADISMQRLNKAMAPIKSFMTRRGNAAGMQMPQLQVSQGTEGQDRKSYSDTQDRESYEVDPNLEKESADISGDMSEAKSELDYNKSEIADEPKATDTVNPDHFAGKNAAAGDECPEEIAIDLGAGDLADIVMVEDEGEMEKTAANDPKRICKKCHKNPVNPGHSSTLCDSCHEDSLSEGERATGVQ